MNKADMNPASLLVRMWKDAAFRQEMNAQGLECPSHPSGASTLSLNEEGSSKFTFAAPCSGDIC